MQVQFFMSASTINSDGFNFCCCKKYYRVLAEQAYSRADGWGLSGSEGASAPCMGPGYAPGLPGR